MVVVFWVVIELMNRINEPFSNADCIYVSVVVPDWSVPILVGGTSLPLFCMVFVFPKTRVSMFD